MAAAQGEEKGGGSPDKGTAPFRELDTAEEKGARVGRSQFLSGRKKKALWGGESLREKQE